jgi:copper chaperone CopZ
MQRVDGVKEVNVDLDSKTAVVTYDSSVTSTTEIGNASTDVGFPASARDNE